LGCKINVSFELSLVVRLPIAEYAPYSKENSRTGKVDAHSESTIELIPLQKRHTHPESKTLT
jgi:hypothetical protein